MEFQVSQEHRCGPVTVIRVEGRVNLGNAAVLQERIQLEHNNGMRSLLIDLTEVESLTSTGLRAIVFAYKLLEGSGDGSQKSTRLKLLNPSSDLLKVLQTAGFDRFIEIHSDRSQALATFQFNRRPAYLQTGSLGSQPDNLPFREFRTSLFTLSMHIIFIDIVIKTTIMWTKSQIRHTPFFPGGFWARAEAQNNQPAIKAADSTSAAWCLQAFL